MWTSMLDKAKEAARVAQEAAEQIENQLNDSVGVPPGGVPGSTAPASSPAITGTSFPAASCASTPSSRTGMPEGEGEGEGEGGGCAGDADVSSSTVAVGLRSKPTPAGIGTGSAANGGTGDVDNGWNDDDDAYDGGEGEGEGEGEEVVDLAEIIPSNPLFPPSSTRTRTSTCTSTSTSTSTSTRTPAGSMQLADSEVDGGIGRRGGLGQGRDGIAVDKVVSKAPATKVGEMNCTRSSSNDFEEQGAVAGSYKMQQQKQQPQQQLCARSEEEPMVSDGDGWDEEDVADVADVDLIENCGVDEAHDRDSCEGKHQEQQQQQVEDLNFTDHVEGNAVAIAQEEDEKRGDENGMYEGESKVEPVSLEVPKETEQDEQAIHDAEYCTAMKDGEKTTTAFSPKVSDLLIVPSSADADSSQTSLSAMRSQIKQLQIALSQREEQLASKAEQLASMQDMFDRERDEAQAKVRETKDEAKRRIGKARERVEAIEKELSAANCRLEVAGAGDSHKADIIAALRSEGESLMRKQSQMEQSVRAARSEARDLSDEVANERTMKEKALTRISDLETQLRLTKDELAGARKGENRAGRLDKDLAALREESGKKANAILGLEQQVKELKATIKALKNDVESAKKDAMVEKERESNDLKRERDDMLADLEMKLRTSEREAAVREDALRHEVGELRKRWQDAVRRADEMSMDLQQSSAPLMRQLESTERQHRSRAAAWAELEMKLRSDLEENITQNEKLVRERNELRASLKRLERASAKKDETLTGAKQSIEQLKGALDQLEAKVEELEEENSNIKKRWEELEAEASENVRKVRSEMMETVLHSEERYQTQVDTLELEVKEEREKRKMLESKLEDLARSTPILARPVDTQSLSPRVAKESKQKKLQSATGQADILMSALATCGDSDDYESNGDEQVDEEVAMPQNGATGPSSFAAMEQLSQGLKGARLELQALQEQLASSEETRESLVTELAEARAASEKLSLFEAKVYELAQEVRKKDLELQGLQDDITEVRLMYRSQLDELLEEKAANTNKIHDCSLLNHSEKRTNPDANNTSKRKANGNGDDIPSPSKMIVADVAAEMMT